MSYNDMFTVWLLSVSGCMMANGLTLMVVGKMLKDKGM